MMTDFTSNRRYSIYTEGIVCIPHNIEYIQQELYYVLDVCMHYYKIHLYMQLQLQVAVAIHNNIRSSLSCVGCTIGKARV